MTVKRKTIFHKLRKFVLRKVLRKAKKTVPANEEFLVFPDRTDTEPLNQSFEAPIKPYNLHIISWNVCNLLRWIEKGGLNMALQDRPHILCLQEIRCPVDKIPEEAHRIPGYHPYWLCSKGSFNGVAIYSRTMPMNVMYGFETDQTDDRVITAEFEKFFLICVLAPSSGYRLTNLGERLSWDSMLKNHVSKLSSCKSVIICGNLNVAHTEIDSLRPVPGAAGTTAEERNRMTELLSLGFIDTFRQLYPRQVAYSTQMTGKPGQANGGNRLDYIIASTRLKDSLVEHHIRSDTFGGSNHCPVIGYFNI